MQILPKKSTVQSLHLYFKQLFFNVVIITKIFRLYLNIYLNNCSSMLSPEIGVAVFPLDFEIEGCPDDGVAAGPFRQVQWLVRVESAVDRLRGNEQTVICPRTKILFWRIQILNNKKI